MNFDFGPIMPTRRYRPNAAVVEAPSYATAAEARKKAFDIDRSISANMHTNADTKYQNAVTMDKRNVYEATHNPITDRMKATSMGTRALVGSGLGLGAGYLASLLVNKKHKKTRNAIRALGALGGGALGAYSGYRTTPASFDFTKTPYPTYARITSDKMYSESLYPRDINIFYYGPESDAAEKNWYNDKIKVLNKEMAKANTNIADANKSITRYNIDNKKALDSITKARNAQFKNWGMYGGGALGALAGAAGTGLLAKKLFKSKNKWYRALGTLLVGAGGAGGAYLGGRLGGYMGGNLVKSPEFSLKQLTPYNIHN